MKKIDISSRQPYPAGALSNFTEYHFVIEGVRCKSMEGFLQSLKFKNIKEQEMICKMVGVQAKYAGKGKNWKKTQTMWWKGKPINRHSEDYQILLDNAFTCLSRNHLFQKALLASGTSKLVHTMGKNDPHETSLTEAEFCSRLTFLRERLWENGK